RASAGHTGVSVRCRSPSPVGACPGKTHILQTEPDRNFCRPFLLIRFPEGAGGWSASGLVHPSKTKSISIVMGNIPQSYGTPQMPISIIMISWRAVFRVDWGG